MERIFADDSVLVTVNGRKQTKADLPKESSSGEITSEHQEDTDRTVRVWNDTAVVTALLWAKDAQLRDELRLQGVLERCVCAHAVRYGGTCWEKPRGHSRRRREPVGIGPLFSTTKQSRRKDRL